ncbi:cell division protein FtsA [Fructilactobacillus lindneri]|uniref:Cell division protein FtsA n=2 Tax=Fructilactobacillus lindneri TaxID=53444 RepID=A0A0R2JME3_9LACO|nr:cell division protein FtsA [Fructilactobacillus lindneri]ANZ59280.1 cell division protein FtsA [Fructilactobacillus lindneri]KRN78363.1 cell division protein ftsA [Fructilactobacillus lindneri DSM 20690 = JCM 11027]POG98883.1 cell division protein FtsA [Fructilactobacillus lindneri]POH00140.1 cell division protein FtsA [Fructilactobacillus lindneri]POH04271.1 cell division protein FtsA [Fructilactobacillus lindneri]
MNDSDIYIGLDIGTTSIKVIVAQKIDGQINVIGVGNEKSEGVSRGIIVDIDKAANAIKKTISQAETKSGVKISSVVVGLPADMISIDRCSGMTNIDDSSREIDDQDVVAVADSAISSNIPQEREVIDLVPEEFKIDGFDGIPDPRGMVGSRLEMKGRIITGPKTIIHNVRKAVNKAGFDIDMMVVNAEAEGKTVLNDPEQDFGTIILDLGGGQSTVAVIHNYELKYVDVDHEGGKYITKDISSVLNTSLKEAENIKREYGFADVSQASAENEFSVNVVGQSQPVKISEKLLSEIIEARLDQIFGRLKDKLTEANALDMPGGMVLTGGVASMQGIAELAANTFGVNVRFFIPDQMGLRHPSFSLALSLVNYESELSDIKRVVRSSFSEDQFPDDNSVSYNDYNESTNENISDEHDSDEDDGAFLFPRRKAKEEKKKHKKKSSGFSLKNFFE